MMRRLFLLLMLGVAACGSDDPPTNEDTDNDVPTDEGIDPGTIALAIDPAAITIAEGSSGNIRFTLTRTGAIADAAVTYTLQDLPSGIAYDISGDVLTLRVPFFAQNKTGMVTVFATANGRNAFAKLTLTVAPPTPIDVRGHIVSFETGLPMPPVVADQITVSAWSRGATTPIVVHPTDDTFSFDDLTPPYDLELSVAVTTMTRHLLLGLGRPDPTVVYYGYSVGRPSGVTHQFRVSSADPDDVGYDHLAYGVICATGADSVAFLDGLTDTTLVGSPGSGSTTCNSTQFMVDLADGVFPANYSSAVASSTVVNLADGALTDLRFAPSAPNNHAIPITYTPAASFAPFFNFFWLPDATRTLSYASAFSVEPLAQVVAPGDANLQTAVCVSAVSANEAFNPLIGGGTTTCRSTSPGVATASFGSLAGPTSPGAPMNTVGANVVAFASIGGFGGYLIDTLTPPQSETIVFTNGQVSSQVLAKHGLPILPGSSYQWQSFKLEGINSIDAFVSTDVTMHGFLTRQAGYSLSATQSFQAN